MASFKFSQILQYGGRKKTEVEISVKISDLGSREHIFFAKCPLVGLYTMM